MTSSQESTINDFNKLLQEASNSIMCGPECQQNKQKSKLYQNYLDAKTTMINAPQMVDESAKKYYMYSEGPVGYNNYINQNLEQKLSIINKEITAKFTDKLNKANSSLELYKGISVNYAYVLELYEYYLKDNKKLETKYKSKTADTLTNDRKTYYENQGIESLDFYYKLVLFIYFVVSIFLFWLLYLNVGLSRFKKIIIVLSVFLYPIIAVPTIRLILWLYYKLIVLLPKNIYNNL
jgi:hypothetical protein